jgi:hypothetical protein
MVSIPRSLLRAALLGTALLGTNALTAQEQPPTPQDPVNRDPETNESTPDATEDPAVDLSEPRGKYRGGGELILDAGELKTVFSEALSPLRQHLEQSTLDKRYAEINSLLSSEEVDTERLITSLRSLKGELDNFVSGLPQIREKLFDGSDSLGERIRDFRMVLAKTRDAQDTVETDDGTTDAMTALDTELSKIAREIKAAEDPKRKSLLKDRFKFLYLARKRIEQVAPHMGGVDEAIMSNVLQFVMSIRAHLDNAATSTIAMQMNLQQQQRMVGQFVVLIENLQATDELAEQIEELSKIQAPNFEELTQTMTQVTRGLVGFTDKLEQKAGAATAKLAERLQQAPVQDVVDSDLELDRLIDEAATRGGNAPVEASSDRIEVRPGR